MAAAPRRSAAGLARIGQLRVRQMPPAVARLVPGPGGDRTEPDIPAAMNGPTGRAEPPCGRLPAPPPAAAAPWRLLSSPGPGCRQCWPRGSAGSGASCATWPGTPGTTARTRTRRSRCLCGSAGVPHVRGRICIIRPATCRKTNAHAVEVGAHRHHCSVVGAFPEIVSLDQRIGKLLIEALTPLTIEAALTVQAELQHRAKDAGALRAAHVERARYHADLARRRYPAGRPRQPARRRHPRSRLEHLPARPERGPGSL